MGYFVERREREIDMKKGLSVLLIAAALFGFYGGAVNLNDVLACKDYWEKEDERTTADLNKLEDGLNQLKENEQAYLDGLDTLAEGEQALADGEAAFAAGQAELAKGEADYAAAPGKLAAGRKKLASGEKALADAVVRRSKLKKVISKIGDVEPAYKPWLKKFDKLRKSIVDNPENPSKGVLYDAGAIAVGLVGNKDNDGILQAFQSLKTLADQASGGAKQAEAGMDKIIAGVKAQLEAAGMTEVTDDDALNALKNNEAFAQLKEQYEGAQEKYVEYSSLAATLTAVYNHLDSTYKSRLVSIAQSINGKIEKIKRAEYQATQLRNTDFSGDYADVRSLLNDISNDAVLKQAAAQKPELAEKLNGGLGQVLDLVSASESSKKSYNKDYDELKPNASMGNKIGKKVAAAAKAILSNDDIKSKMSGKQVTALKPYMQSGSITGLPNIELLYGTMTLGKDKKDDGKNSLLDSLKALKEGAVGGVGQLTDGIVEGKNILKSGRAELNEGLANYYAAPAKLAAGRAKLADAEQQLNDGRKQLADGKEKLAEYEDGEQQVRDGLATLMASEANGGLQSILDRRSGDEDFDNGDEHLELNEGLDAVSVGREYKADSGELVTAEIMKRAIGTGLGLAAGALAVLAGLLSLLKKNKGAGVCAALTAIAGGAGIAAGTSAGMEFSSIAGSAVGATPWIAFGVLAAVAAVHAIAHFADKPEA